MKAGDVICLEMDVNKGGIQSSHFRDLTEHQFAHIVGCSKAEWFLKNNVPAHVYIRPTTRKDGRTRSLIAPDRGKNSQLAVFDDEIFGVGSYEFTRIPERWVPIFAHSKDCPEGGGTLKPIMDTDVYTAWSEQRQDYLRVPTRWGRNLMFCRPYDLQDGWEDAFEMELLPAAPGVNGVNFRVNGGGSKTGRPKLGAGMRLYNAQSEPSFPNCHDNKYLKHHQDQHPREAEEWYIPWGEFRPKFRWHDDAVPKGSITINFPITGIGKIISGVPRQPRGRVRTPRPKETDDDYYHPMQPQGSTRYPPMPATQRQTGNPFAPQPQTPTQPFMPTTQAPNPYQTPKPKPYYETPQQRVKRLMDKLMAGESLTTEELMELQRFD